MKQFELDFAYITIFDTQTVLLRAKDGVEIDAEKTHKALHYFTNEMPSDYGIIIDRKADYSLVPIDVYRTLNVTNNLKAIAIVLNGKKSALPENTEKNLFKGELAVFQTVAEARAWLSLALI